MLTSRRRAQPRVQANIGVKMRLPNGALESTQRIKNVSLGGVFIEMAEPIAFGSEISLEFSLPVAPRTIRCKGFVAWSTKTSPERVKGNQKGIGVRLMEIGIADMRTLAEYIEAELAT